MRNPFNQCNPLFFLHLFAVRNYLLNVPSFQRKMVFLPSFSSTMSLPCRGRRMV